MLFSAVAHGAERELLDPLTARVLHAPTPVRGDDGRVRLTYELHVTNMLAQPVTITRVAVSDPAQQLQIIAKPELAGSFRPFGVEREQWEEEQRSQADRLTLRAGMSGLVYLSVVLPEPQLTRGPLLHRLEAEVGTGKDLQAYTVELLPVALSGDPVVRIGPPLRGGPWLAANGPSNTSGHRRLAISLNGRVTIFQRYAIDYLKLDARGHRSVGNEQNNRSYFTEGEEVIAVADAVVVAAKDEFSENVPGSVRPGASLDTIYGNSVVLSLGDGRYAIYAHLQPGSVRVKNGDRVRLGQVLGRAGNTGNSILPHLHFQLADAAAPLSGEGVPYAHDRFKRIGSCADDLEGACTLGSPQTVVNAIPLNHSVVRFP